MTCSIVARDQRTGEYGIACVSRALALGAVVPYGSGRNGALATPALANPFYGVDGLNAPGMLLGGEPERPMPQPASARAVQRRTSRPR